MRRMSRAKADDARGEELVSVVDRAYVLRAGALIRGLSREPAQAGKFVAGSDCRGIGMADIRQVSERFWVAPQLMPEDFAQLASAGFQHIINNRPDSEAPEDMTSAKAEAAAKAAGLTYVHAPFVGQPTADAVKAALNASGRTLAYCRSGTRSVTAWAMAEASQGEEVQYIIEAVADAGYNLAPMAGLLKQLGGK